MNVPALHQSIPPFAPAGNCHFCGSAHLRRAKTRENDWLWLFLLKWPVRCMSCLKRAHIPVWRALRAIPASVAHSGEFAAKGTWSELAEEPKDKTDAA